MEVAVSDFFLHQLLGFRFELHCHTFKLAAPGARCKLFVGRDGPKGLSLNWILTPCKEAVTAGRSGTRQIRARPTFGKRAWSRGPRRAQPRIRARSSIASGIHAGPGCSAEECLHCPPRSAPCCGCGWSPDRKSV